MGGIDGLMAHRAGRPLTVLERGVLSAIFNDQCPDATVLRAQLLAATVAREWEPEGSPSIDITVPDDARSSLTDNILPMNAWVYATDGTYLGELIVWLSQGRLSALEYAWVTDLMPRSLPGPGLLKVSRK